MFNKGVAMEELGTKALAGGAIGLFTATLFVGNLLTFPITNADNNDSVTSTAAVSVESACQMDARIDIPHTIDISAGTYQDNIGKTTIKILCNDPGGHALYAIGYSNTEVGRTEMLGSATGRTIPTGTATSGNASAWAMKLTAVQGTYTPTILSDDDGSYANYHVIPSDFAKVASYNSTSNVDQDGSRVETTYAAYVNPLQLPDTYTCKVKYTLIHPSDSTDKPCTGNYTINYNANGGSGNMDSQTSCIDRQITLLPNGFTPPAPISENQFVAWNTAADGSGHTYYAGQSVANLAEIGSSATLYAQWAPKYIQDLTPTMCSIVASEQPITVIDRRDGNDYTVRYLNNACWMTQNLRIAGIVNSTNSNFSTYENVNVCEGDLTAGNSYDEPRCHDSGNTTNGVWYNYAAASAKTIVGSRNSTLDTENICPANWTLPSRDTSKPAGSIDSLPGSTSAVTTAFSPVPGGSYSGGSVSYPGHGYWWSTTDGGGGGGRYTLYYSGSGLSTNTSNRDGGCYVRCVRVSQN